MPFALRGWVIVAPAVLAACWDAEGSVIEPVSLGGSGWSAAWVEEDFAGYGSTAQLVNTPNPAVWVQGGHSANLGQIALDQSVGYAAGGLSQSMRYDFAGIGAQCTDYSIRLGGFKFPAPIQPGQSVWVETVARFASSFTTDAGATACGKDYKFLLITANPGGRVELKSGTYGIPGRWYTNYPGGVADTDGFTTASAWDGQWHTYRIYAKVSSTSSTADGAYAVWVDGVKIVDRQNIAYSNMTSLPWVWPGANVNQGPLSPTSVWWGRIRAWNTNPGW